MRYLVIDTGYYTDIASALSDGGRNQVYYFTSWAGQSFPSLQDYAAGTGYERLIKVKRLFTDVDLELIDCIVNFDMGHNDIIAYLRDRFPEKSIVGSGYGELIEEDREQLKQWCEEFGLDVAPYEVLVGIDALESYAKSHQDFYVKMDIFRKSMETIHIEDYDSAVKENEFAILRREFGPVFSQTVKFLVEKGIDSDCEIGFDGFFTPEGGYGNAAFLGYEYKKGPYLAKVYDPEELPENIQETMDAFIPLLEELDYRGPLSTEEKLLPDGRHYLLDWCSRLLAPGSSLYPRFIVNWPQLIYEIGLGGDFHVEVDYFYVGALPLTCAEGKDKYLWLKIDEEYRQDIRPMSVCSDGNDLYSVRGNEVIAVLVAGGDSPKEVMERLTLLVDHVDFEGIDRNQVRILEEFPRLIREGQTCGIDF